MQSRYFVTIIAFLLFVSNAVLANEKYYGNFRWIPKTPSYVYFSGEIKRADSFDLRKAMRHHEIEGIVISSPGGIIGEGLSIAGIINDNKLSVIIPEGRSCASACSFVFLAGKSRIAKGELGVHQFYYGGDQKTGSIEQIQQQSQYTVSEIIGFLNEFDTPGFVFERMFQGKDMYWFDSKELAEISRNPNNIEESTVQNLSNEYKNLYPADDNSGLSEKAAILIVQGKLLEAGCYQGKLDGVWGEETSKAANRFAQRVGIATSNNLLNSKDFMKALMSNSNKVCAKPRPVESQPQVSSKELAFKDTYVAKCVSGNSFSDMFFSVRLSKKSKTGKLIFSGGSGAFAWSGMRHEFMNEFRITGDRIVFSGDAVFGVLFQKSGMVSQIDLLSKLGRCTKWSAK